MIQSSVALEILSVFPLYSQIIVEVLDRNRGLGTGVKRSLDDGDGKSYTRAKTRERYEEATKVITGPKRFVCASIVEQQEILRSSGVIDENSSKEESNPDDGTQQSSKDEKMDIFAE